MSDNTSAKPQGKLEVPGRCTGAHKTNTPPGPFYRHYALANTLTRPLIFEIRD
jgi:hypothetical protein